MAEDTACWAEDEPPSEKIYISLTPPLKDVMPPSPAGATGREQQHYRADQVNDQHVQTTGQDAVDPPEDPVETASGRIHLHVSIATLLASRGEYSRAYDHMRRAVDFINATNAVS